MHRLIAVDNEVFVAHGHRACNCLV